MYLENCGQSYEQIHYQTVNLSKLGVQSLSLSSWTALHTQTETAPSQTKNLHPSFPSHPTLITLSSFSFFYFIFDFDSYKPWQSL